MPGIRSLLDSIMNPKTGRGVLSRHLHARETETEIQKALVEAKEACELFFSDIMNNFCRNKVSTRIMKTDIIDNTLRKPLLHISSLLRSLCGRMKTEEESLESIRQIRDILIATQGRSFVFFTSFQMLNIVYEGIKTSLSSFALFKQGDKPRYKLVEEFKTSHKSGLFGTITFWQGIDVPGKALECVIITRLPFAVPDDPITEARMELLKTQNRDPFMHYQMPQAITLLRQGFGRLIRANSDIGIVAILDPRIKTRYYGRFFLNSLPDCGKVSDIKSIESFLDKHRG